MFTRFVANSEKCRKHAFLRGSTQNITILHRGGHWNLLQYYNLFIYYNITRGRGGSLGTPNLYYVIYGRPLIYNWVISHGSPFVKPWHNPTSNSISFWRVFTPAIGGAGFADFNSQIQPQPPPPLQQCIIQGETLQDKNYLIFWQKCNDNPVKMKRFFWLILNRFQWKNCFEIQFG